MQNINSFLEKFKKLLRYNKEIKETIKGVIKEKIGVELDDKDIKIQNKVLYIKTTPYVKNEIFIKKDIILEKLNSLLDKKSPKDIR